MLGVSTAQAAKGVPLAATIVFPVVSFAIYKAKRLDEVGTATRA